MSFSSKLGARFKLRTYYIRQWPRHYNACMPRFRVLYDGWPLIHQPNHAQSIHLRTLLALAPEETESVLALPMENDHGIGQLAETVELLSVQEDDAGTWKQKQLPRLAEQYGAQIIHTSSRSASLFGRVNTIISPADFGSQESGEYSLRSRLGQSLGRGGLARAHILWPSDLPKSQLPGTQLSLDPVVHPAFIEANADPPAHLDLPETYILYHGPTDPPSMLKLLESWTWAASSIGEYFPLLILGLEEKDRNFVKARLPEFHVEDYVKLLPALPFEDLIAVYQHCSALAHLAPPSAWGGPIRHALASAKPVVASNDPSSEALVGPAAYLVPPDDLRAFGAALISVVVDEKVTEKLEEAARKRASNWNKKKFTEELLSVYGKIL